MNTKHPSHSVSRRDFLKTSAALTAGISGFPTIIPSSVLGKDAPSKKIHIGQIGCGRISHEMDMPGILKHDIARVVAVCDLDSKRMDHAKRFVQDHYAKKESDRSFEVKTYSDFRDLLKDKGIDAVAISTPDHWHSEPVVAAAIAGKATCGVRPTRSISPASCR